MIDITVVLGEDGVLRKLEVSGHSDYKDENDVVCAAVSVLTQTFYLSLINIPEINYFYSDKDGFLKITVDKYCEVFASELRGISMFLTLGLEAISKKYKNFVNLKMSKGV